MTYKLTSVQHMLELAAAQKVADIHIVTATARSGVWFRICGDLVPQVDDVFTDPAALCGACSDLADTTVEKLLAEGVGQIDPARLPKFLDFAKVAIQTESDGCAMVLRLGYRNTVQEAVKHSELGYSQDQIDAIKERPSASANVKIVSGPAYTVKAGRPLVIADDE